MLLGSGLELPSTCHSSTTLPVLYEAGSAGRRCMAFAFVAPSMSTLQTTMRPIRICAFLFSARLLPTLRTSDAVLQRADAFVAAPWKIPLIQSLVVSAVSHVRSRLIHSLTVHG